MVKASLHKPAAYLLLSLFLSTSALAQNTESGAVPANLILPDGTPITVRLANSVSSAHARVGDVLDFVVVKDVSREGLTVVPAGSIAHGSITGVKGRRLLGIGGRVSLKLDSVELVNGEQANLRASKVVKGGSRTKLMLAAMVATSIIFLPATPVFLLTRGHDSTVVKSTEITAQVEGDYAITSAGLRQSPPSSTEMSQMMDYLPPRVFNAEGREGDMVNLVFVAQPQDLQEAFARAGWVQTDKWTPAFAWHLLQHGDNDISLPMARFYLFGRVQDYSYALPDPDAVVSRRHHLRIWNTGYTENGTPIWAGAATHDVAIEIAKRGRIINHRIDPAVDTERDFVGANLTETSSVTQERYLHGVDPVFQAQTASGETYHSDSRILLLALHHVSAGNAVATDRPSSPPPAAPGGIGVDSFASDLTMQP